MVDVEDNCVEAEVAGGARVARVLESILVAAVEAAFVELPRLVVGSITCCKLELDC